MVAVAVVVVAGVWLAVGRSGASAASASPSPTASSSVTVSPSPTATPTESSAPTPTPTPTFDLTANSTTDPSSIWVVVNKQHPVVPSSWGPGDLVAVGSVQVREVIATDLRAMIDAAAADGVTLQPRSGFRSYSDQAAARAAIEARRGYEHAERYSARAGYSEHQTGLVLDLASITQPGCTLKLCFADTVEGQWVAAHANEYGFILRYTDANTETTGYAGEPWHLRYVSPDLVAYMAENGLTTLEETFGVSGGTTYAEG